MKKSIVTVLLLAPFFLYAQTNTMLSADFWKAKPDVAGVKAEIEKGNSPTEANRGNYDVVSIAINNDAPLESIKYLIEIKGNGVDKKTHDGRTYLHWSASRGNEELTKYLIAGGWNIHLTDDKGATPITFAAANGQTNTSVYDALFKAGVDPKQKYQDGANILLLAILGDTEFILTEYLKTKGLTLHDKDDLGRSAFDYAARSGNVGHLKNILQKGVGPTRHALILASQGSRRANSTLETYQYLINDLKITASVTGMNGENALHNIVRKPNQKEIIAFFLEKGVDINVADKDGNTVFIAAASTKDIDVINSLLPKVKDINAANKKGETALVAAVQSSSPEVVQLLIDKGAKTDIQSTEGNLAYYLVQAYRGQGPGNNADDFTKKMNILTEKGFDFTAPQADGSTLYHIAVTKNDVSLFQKLENLKIDINAKNTEGMTVLHRAALLAKDDTILKYLVEKGADISITTEFEESAYDLASENEALKEKNISINFLK